MRQNELYANNLIELNNNATIKILNTNIGNVINLSRHRSFKKLINVTCFVFRFLKNFSCKIKKQYQCFKEESVSIEEREEAINRWIIYEQDCLRQQLSKVIFVIEFIWRVPEYFMVERKIWQFIIRIRSEMSYYIAWLWKLIYEIVNCWCA